ncbi:hypothetical protein BGW41_007569 [Actinomortierella wolfii]|nr:hypothetical protein BGW41_007569 [Actinomortierella wolfii]
MDSSPPSELPSDVSPSIHHVLDGPASWTASQGGYTEPGGGLLDDDEDVDMQDSDPDDTTDNNLDQEPDQEQVYRSKEGENDKLRMQVERELQATINRIAEINAMLDYYKERAFDPPAFGDFVPEPSLKDSQTTFQVTAGRSHSNSFSTSDFADNEEDHKSIHSSIADMVMSLRNVQDSPSVRIEHLTHLVNILKQNPNVHPGYPIQDLVSCFRFCLTSTVREIRLNAYRCLRFLSGTGEVGPLLKKYKIDFFIIRSLMSDQRLESERIEALKLVRCFITSKEGMQFITDGVLRAVISIAEQADDKLRNACLETLGEMVMSDPMPVARCGGFRSLLLALTDNLQDLSDALLQVFLYMLETPETRKYVRQGLDSEIIFKEKGVSKPTLQEMEEYREMHKELFGLVDHHQSVVLTIFLEAGLLEALINLIEDDGRNPKPDDPERQIVVRKAMLLIPELMQLSARVLPSSKSIQIHSLAPLFKLATNFQDPILRHVATHAFKIIDTINGSESGIKPERQEVNQGQVDRSQIRAASQVDEVEFRTMLLDSLVLQTKEPKNWRWPKILEIIQGPLLNPRRLDDAVRGTKFMKRLLAFYRPLNRRYSSEKEEGKHSFTSIGCTLFNSLAMTAEGTKFLMHNKILRLIADGLSQLVPVHGQPGSDPIFSRESMENTITPGYFEMLGTLCKSKNGLKLLEKFKIFDLYYRVSELRSRDDVVKKIITSMDYQLDGHPRVILSKIMTSGYKHIRLFATQHLGNVLRTANHEFCEWGIRLLTTQLYDPSLDVCQMAVKCLDDACSNPKNLDLLIRLRPNLDHLGDVGSPLLLRFLSTSRGFHHLHEMSYIESQMDDWFMNTNRSYMIQTEIRLAKAMELSRFNPFSADGKFENDAELQLQRARQVILPHFYGELTRTEEGCHLLRMKGHFAEYARYIREHCAEYKDTAIISELKSVLWAVGNIGSTTGGLPFLEEEDLFKYIVGMAERSKVLSVKGTCFYVLGLLCKTEQGIEILEDYDWEGIVGEDKVPKGLCLPKYLDRFLDVPPWDYVRVQPPPLDIPLAKDGNAIEQEILKYIGELSNHILTSGASKALQKLKTECPTYFSSLTLYSAVMQILGHYHYRLPVRRFILGLFDIRLEGSAMLDRLDQIGQSMPDASKNTQGGMSAASTSSSATPNAMHHNKRSASTGALTGIVSQLAGGSDTGQQGNKNSNNSNGTTTEQGRSRRSVTMPSSIMAPPPPLPRKSLDGGVRGGDDGQGRNAAMSTSGVAYPIPPSPTQSQHARTTERKLMQPPLPIITSSLLQSNSNRFHTGNGNGSNGSNGNAHTGGRASPVTIRPTEIGIPLVPNQRGYVTSPNATAPTSSTNNNGTSHSMNPGSNGTATETIASLSKALIEISLQKGGNGVGRPRVSQRTSFESPVMPLSPTDGGDPGSPRPESIPELKSGSEGGPGSETGVVVVNTGNDSPQSLHRRRQKSHHRKESSSTGSVRGVDSNSTPPSRPESGASTPLIGPSASTPSTVTTPTQAQTQTQGQGQRQEPPAPLTPTPLSAGTDSTPGSPMRPPPIPPPRPPPHAYEILYTNKPYHKNFAKEAKLEPLPPRVKVKLNFEENEDSL